METTLGGVAGTYEGLIKGNGNIYNLGTFGSYINGVTGLRYYHSSHYSAQYKVIPTVALNSNNITLSVTNKTYLALLLNDQIDLSGWDYINVESDYSSSSKLKIEWYYSKPSCFNDTYLTTGDDGDGGTTFTTHRVHYFDGSYSGLSSKFPTTISTTANGYTTKREITDINGKRYIGISLPGTKTSLVIYRIWLS